MKKLLFSIIALAGFNFAQAQDAKESSIEIMKATQPCVEATYNRPSELMEDALKKKLADAKVGSGDKSKGFKVYKGIILPEISTDKIDLYTKIDGKKDNTTVYMLVSKGYDNFVSGAKDEAIVTNMKNFLNGLEVNAAALKLLADIEAAKIALNNAQDKYSNAVSDGKDLVKQKEKIEKNIEENKSIQSARSKDVDNANANLKALMALIK
jgi:hypothetical protein